MTKVIIEVQQEELCGTYFGDVTINNATVRIEATTWGEWVEKASLFALSENNIFPHSLFGMFGFHDIRDFLGRVA